MGGNPLPGLTLRGVNVSNGWKKAAELVMAIGWEKAAELVMASDLVATEVAVLLDERGSRIQIASAQVFIARGSGSMIKMPGIQIQHPDGYALAFLISDPGKMVAQLVKASIESEESNRSLEQPVDLSNVHSRSRAAMPHRTQRKPGTKKPTRGRN